MIPKRRLNGTTCAIIAGRDGYRIGTVSGRAAAGFLLGDTGS